MGVYSFCGFEHVCLCHFSGKAKFLKGLCGWMVKGLSSDSGTSFKIRPKGAGTIHKGENVHVFMASISVAVHQPWFWGGADLVEKRFTGQSGGLDGIIFFHGLIENLCGFFLKLLNRVGAAAGAVFGRIAADQTGSGRPSHTGTLGFFSSWS